MDAEKGYAADVAVGVPRQSNAWSICSAGVGTAGALAAIVAAAMVGNLKECSTDPTPGATVVTNLASEMKKVDHSGAQPWLQHAYASVVGAIDEHFTAWSAKVKPIGWHTARLAESGDASDGAGNPEFKYIGDGKDGKTDWGFGPLAPILTIGEADANTGYVPVGVPDGLGVMRKDIDTLRVIFQAESYGYLSGGRSWFMPVNGNGAKFTGSHVSYIDYRMPTTAAAYSTSDLTKLSYDFATTADSNAVSAAPAVKEAGSLFTEVYNMKGEMVVKRDGTNQITVGAHLGDTSVDGHYVTGDSTTADAVASNAWTFHSFCSSHLEEARQWSGSASGVTYGVENDMWVTVEEWTDLDAAKTATHGFAGLTAHVIDIASKKLYATGAFGQGGYEKIVEFNCGHEDFVCFSPSGYNGNFGGDAMKTAIVNRRKAIAAKRPDNTDWVYPQNVVPARIYVGRKGYKADGTKCGASCTFLERNGLEFGQLYGYAVPTATTDRDAWHKGNVRTASTPTHTVAGKWAKIAWQFNSSNVKNVEESDMFHWQIEPVLPSGVTGYKFWNGKGNDAAGAKTEHNSPSPVGEQKFVQGSTAGYFGIYEVQSMVAQLNGAAAGGFPTHFDGTYDMIEGETDIDTRVNLCPAGSGCTQGQTANGRTQKYMNDGTEKRTFEDIDGLEWIAAKSAATDASGSVTLNGKTYTYDDYFVIQEDGGNKYGERLLVAKMPAAKSNATYDFIAMAGGSLNTRMKAGVSVPPNTFNSATSSEFSGVADASGALRQTMMGGAARRLAELDVIMNDKTILIGLQQHSIRTGVVSKFGADRGGQIYMWDVANF